MEAHKEFAQEYRIASEKIHNHSFNHILNQHAVVMVDGALPKLQLSQYVEIGTRLGDVQNGWVDLLCDSLHGDDMSRDRAYQETVKRVITNFGRKLNQVLLEDKVVPYQELAAPGIFLHSKVSPRAESHLKETQRLFETYIKSLIHLYQTQNEESYKKSSANCIRVADSLGSWLDHTIFS